MLMGAFVALLYMFVSDSVPQRTRWTLSVCFNILPWKPVARFTGISEYTVDNRARVVRQVDYWDSINLIEGNVETKY